MATSEVTTLIDTSQESLATSSSVLAQISTQQLLELYEEGLSVPKIADQLGPRLSVDEKSQLTSAIYHRLRVAGYEARTSSEAAQQNLRSRAPTELPICAHCGKVRVPVPYSICDRYGDPTLLCENRCCPDPDCAGTLEIHNCVNKSTRKVVRSYWTHVSPMPPRKCVVDGVEFRPNARRRPHSKTCSTRCKNIYGSRNWKAAHPERVKEYDKEAGKRRTEKVRFADQAAKTLAEKEKELAQARQRVVDLTAQVAEAKKLADGQEGEIARAVDDAIPRFQLLFSTPEIERNPKLLLSNWQHPDFTCDEILAARHAYMGRKAKEDRPVLAARWFVADAKQYPIETVRRYHNRHKNGRA